MLQSPEKYLAAQFNLTLLGHMKWQKIPHPIWPIVEHTLEGIAAPAVHHGDVIVPIYDFPDDIYSEYSHYSILMTDFLKTNDNNKYQFDFLLY